MVAYRIAATHTDRRRRLNRSGDVRELRDLSLELTAGSVQRIGRQDHGEPSGDRRRVRQIALGAVASSGY
jgi:hypothetical protein